MQPEKSSFHSPVHGGCLLNKRPSLLKATVSAPHSQIAARQIARNIFNLPFLLSFVNLILKKTDHWSRLVNRQESRPVCLARGSESPLCRQNEDHGQ